GLQVRCPDEMRGRVLAGDFALITLSLGISSLVAGVVSEYIGAFKEAGVTVLQVNPVGPDPVREIETLRSILDEA
ncbi:MAG: hypothetical protein ACKOHO_03610, partial [Acidimicrobiaceae bacterium]